MNESDKTKLLLGTRQLLVHYKGELVYLAMALSQALPEERIQNRESWGAQDVLSEFDADKILKILEGSLLALDRLMNLYPVLNDTLAPIRAQTSELVSAWLELTPALKKT